MLRFYCSSAQSESRSSADCLRKHSRSRPRRRRSTMPLLHMASPERRRHARSLARSPTCSPSRVSSTCVRVVAGKNKAYLLEQGIIGIVKQIYEAHFSRRALDPVHLEIAVIWIFGAKSRFIASSHEQRTKKTFCDCSLSQLPPYEIFPRIVRLQALATFETRHLEARGKMSWRVFACSKCVSRRSPRSLPTAPKTPPALRRVPQVAHSTRTAPNCR